MQNLKSPISGSSNIRLVKDIPSIEVITLYQDAGIDVSRFFENILNISIYECLDSGYQFYYPFTIDGDGLFYQDLRSFPGYFREWKWEYGKVSSIIPSDTQKILEIGCGHGTFLSHLKSRGIKGTGIELTDSSVKECIQKGLDVKNELLSTHKIKHLEEYDIVCSFQVLEHISDVSSFVNDSLKVLKKGGLLTFAVPNNEASLVKYGSGIFNMPPHHMGLWSKNSLSNLEKFFSVKLQNIYFEPLPDYERDRYRNLNFPAIINFAYKLNWRIGSLSKRLLSFLLQIFKNQIKGHTIIAVFKKI
ncbi:class I SAM-dependent methyltransferase [Cytophagaceae bacterium DM2B3-1]|uniref:Class I SAM-dependent methyltransferase n=1 Tax=Xanthocytophaga flava TaxID=3048013 RepID=A0ABT7CDZ3_9BACT|nr:class I SAM-dependent methyltransferase [Xanthocytophaga flavus]MDJ1473728.1 class I SAM-dependent methyltransferase [Xanthocytophaga flavus]MDJ1491951.1 class I SAM-dependent methyltransferase [Xanthocytophaga flavus]